MNKNTLTPCSAKECVYKIIQEFNHKQVSYCFLRNAEFLQENRPYAQADLDILIRSKDLSKIEHILSSFGFVRTHQSTVRRHVGFIAYLPPNGVLLALDLHLDHPSWNDIPYFPGNLLLDAPTSREPHGPGPEQTAALLVLHSILDKKTFKPKYINLLNQLIDTNLDGQVVLSHFENIATPALAQELLSRLLERRFGALLELRSRVIRTLLGWRPTAWANLLACLIRSRWKSLRNRLFPRALLVALVGADGAGKSTVGTDVVQRLKDRSIPVSQFYMGRWHSHVLPLANLARTHGATAVSQQASPPSGSNEDPVHIQGRPFYRFARDTVYILEMALRYAVRLKPALRRGGIVLTDRYAWDLLLDPGVTWLSRWILPSWYPRPHYCFYLHHNAEVLHARKLEQSLEEIQRQLDVFAKYTDPLNLIPIHGGDLDQNTDQIARSIILKYLE